jgi:hypothetical protein
MSILFGLASAAKRATLKNKEAKSVKIVFIHFVFVLIQN